MRPSCACALLLLCCAHPWCTHSGWCGYATSPISYLPPLSWCRWFLLLKLFRVRNWSGLRLVCRCVCVFLFPWGSVEEGGGAVVESMTSAAAFVEGGVQDACDDACSICLESFCDEDPATVTPELFLSFCCCCCSRFSLSLICSSAEILEFCCLLDFSPVVFYILLFFCWSICMMLWWEMWGIRHRLSCFFAVMALFFFSLPGLLNTWLFMSFLLR